MISVEEQRQVIKDLAQIMGADVKRIYAAITTSLIGEQLSSVNNEKRKGLEADLANQLIYFEVLKNVIGVDENLLNRELHAAFANFKQFIDDSFKADTKEPVIGSSVIGLDTAGGKEPTLAESLKELDKAVESKPTVPFVAETMQGSNGEKLRFAGESIEDKAKKAFSVNNEKAEDNSSDPNSEDLDKHLETDNYPETNPPS